VLQGLRVIKGHGLIIVSMLGHELADGCLIGVEHVKAKIRQPDGRPGRLRDITPERREIRRPPLPHSRVEVVQETRGESKGSKIRGRLSP